MVCFNRPCHFKVLKAVFQKLYCTYSILEYFLSHNTVTCARSTEKFVFHWYLQSLGVTILGKTFLMKPSNFAEMGPTTDIYQDHLAILRIEYVKRKQCIEKWDISWISLDCFQPYFIISPLLFFLFTIHWIFFY